MPNDSISQPAQPLATESSTKELVSETLTDSPNQNAHKVDAKQTPGEVIASAVAAEVAKTDEVALPELSEAQLAALLKTIKRKITVNGADRELSIDELEKDYQLKSASHENMRKAAAMRKQVEEYTALLRSDPRKALKLFGVDVRQLAEAELSEALEEEMLTADQRKVRDLEKRLSERDAAEQTAADAKRHADEEAQVPVLRAQYDTDIQAALRGAGLPVTPSLMRAVAAQARRDLDDSIEINFSAIAEELSQQYRGNISEVVSNSDIEKLVALLGESGMKKIREYELAKLKQTAPAVRLEDQGASKDPSKKVKESLEQYMARRRKAVGID